MTQFKAQTTIWSISCRSLKNRWRRRLRGPRFASSVHRLGRGTGHKGFRRGSLCTLQAGTREALANAVKHVWVPQKALTSDFTKFKGSCNLSEEGFRSGKGPAAGCLAGAAQGWDKHASSLNLQTAVRALPWLCGRWPGLLL